MSGPAAAGTEVPARLVFFGDLRIEAGELAGDGKQRQRGLEMLGAKRFPFLLAEYLQAVGIKAKLNFMQYAAMRDLARSGKVAIAHQTWGSNLINDTSASTPVYFGGGGDDLTKDPEVIKLLDKADHTIDPKERKETYNKALVMISEKAYAVPLWTLPVYYVANKDVKFTPYHDELVRFWEMGWK